MTRDRASLPIGLFVVTAHTARREVDTLIMLHDRDRIFTNLYGFQPPTTRFAERRGIWQETKRLVDKGPVWIRDEIRKAGLRGRGGAGFPTGLKWSFVSQEDDRPRYLVVNADEGEPGTCKDRDIIRHEPHLLIEGCLFSAVAIGAHVCYIYVRGEFMREREALQFAINEAYEARRIGPINHYDWPLDVFLHHGAGAYIAGEETALLESLEGKKALPRMKPPYPTECGLYGCPTVVNNVETIAAVGTILRRGSAWFADLGTPNNTGTKIFCVSGHVNKPCNVEEELGITFRQLVERHCGGVRGGCDNLLAVIPGGAATPIVPAAAIIDAPLDFDSLLNLNSALGTGGVIVFDKSTDIVRAIERISRFYMHESCGQCTPCREGAGWVWRMLSRMADGRATTFEVETLLDLTNSIEGHTICGLGDSVAWPVQGLIRHFRGEIEGRSVARQ
jgi:NADH-quinone oxidoreductase subunit F